MRGADTAIAALKRRPTVLFFLVLLLFPSAVRADNAAAIVTPPPVQGYGFFPLDARLEPRVRFWVEVYARYHSWEMAIHDAKLPQLIYSSVDTRNRPKSAVQAEKDRLTGSLRRLAVHWKEIKAGTVKRELLKPDDRKLLELFEREQLVAELPVIAGDPQRLRAQAGLRDALEDALFVSGRYLPRMEKVFESFGLPIEIAYLPFVESGFNKRAVSKVGASGIWQFMPYTGKLYLRVDSVVDERNDPMRAAEAAARLMKQNFATLGEWPLAITAYNHGTQGVARAAKEIGSNNITDIIEKFEGKTFGFASQNFYASFLAALHVAKNSEAYLGMVPRARKLEFDEFVMPDYMELGTFLAKMGIDETFFRELNPALTQEVYSGEKYIPVGYTVRVPLDVRTDFLARYEAISATLKFQQQKGSAAYVAPLPPGTVSAGLISDRKTP